MNNIKIIMPAGAMGANELDDAVDSLLRLFAMTIQKNGEWAEKYGTEINNDKVMMHEYCWCEQDDCPWCMDCNCPESATHWIVDGKEVLSHKEWQEFFERETYDKLGIKRDIFSIGKKQKEWDRLAKVADERRTTRHDKICPFCKGELHNDLGAEAGQPAPNFWYKPLNFKVWWYKYIGRDMRTNKQLTKHEFTTMMKDLLTDTKEG